MTLGSCEKRDMDATQRFFQQAARTVVHGPEQVTTDGHGSSSLLSSVVLGGTHEPLGTTQTLGRPYA